MGHFLPENNSCVPRWLLIPHSNMREPFLHLHKKMSRINLTHRPTVENLQWKPGWFQSYLPSLKLPPKTLWLVIFHRNLCINQFQWCPSPPGNRRAFAHVVSPGGGAFAILLRPWGLGISIPRGSYLTQAFSKDR